MTLPPAPTSELFDLPAFNSNLAADRPLRDSLKAAITEADKKLDDRFRQSDDIRDLIHDRSDFFDALLAQAWRNLSSSFLSTK